MNNEEMELKVCKICGKELPLDRFELIKPEKYKPYHISTCKKCRYKIRADRKSRLSENIKLIIERKYKKINQERILNLSEINIEPIGIDEIFVKLMEYKEVWLSNYGRAIRFSGGEYTLLKEGYDAYGSCRYSVSKNVFCEGKWTYKKTQLYATQAVVQEFIVNPDTVNNIFIWHRHNNKSDNYYKNLYPLNKEQYYALKRYYNKNDDDSEDVIVKIMNDIQYKPDNWSIRSMKPTVCGIGYHGREGDNWACNKAYLRWHDMMNRCYNDKFLERQPQYKECTVCEEWWNFCNFEKWYNEHCYEIEDESMDLDKDILFKGNKEYSPSTCCIVPHSINTLFLTGKKNRGKLPLGIWFDKDKGRYRAHMNYEGIPIKIGTFKTVEEAFARYKEYKEDFIKDIAEQYSGKIPDKVYQAMVNWRIEITD